MIRKIISLHIILLPFVGVSQMVLLNENFNSGIPASWTIVNEDGLIPDTSVAEFTDGWISYVEGIDTCAASTSYYEPTGTASDYLISPRISIGTFSKIVWSARSLDASYPDGYVVLISTTDSLIGSFTDTLAVVSAEYAYFNTRGVDLTEKGFANQDVFIAIQNNTENGFILLLNDFLVLGSESASITPTKAAPLVNIYPNPCINQFQINAGSAVVQVKIVNQQGQVVLQSNNETRIDISSLSTGVYFVEIETVDGISKQLISKTY